MLSGIKIFNVRGKRYSIKSKLGKKSCNIKFKLGTWKKEGEKEKREQRQKKERKPASQRGYIIIRQSRFPNKE